MLFKIRSNHRTRIAIAMIGFASVRYNSRKLGMIPSIETFIQDGFFEP